MTTASLFPIDCGDYQPLALDPSPIHAHRLHNARPWQRISSSAGTHDRLFYGNRCCPRCGRSHGEVPYDTVPEVMILDALFRGSPDQFVPIFFDEAGHRVATQYLMAMLEGALPKEQLLHYREAHSTLPGHPELGLTPGVKFSSGRLGHMWPYVNGVAPRQSGADGVLFGLGWVSTGRE